MMVKNFNKNFLINLSLILSIFLFDRFSKIYVIYLNEENLGLQIFSSRFLNINLVWNEGIAFGLLSFNQNNLYDFLTIFIFIVILIILFLSMKSIGLKRYSLLVIFGGALGNLFDRIFYKAVPDFFDFHVGNFHWFIFNVSDIFITIGVISMIFLELFNSDKENAD
tara:strand:+ start:252 stop:749 length:498 start_codon:yes stop_codon:yes gene_type:complete